MRTIRATVAVLAAAAVSVPSAAPALAADPTLTFPYTGEVQTLVVPDGAVRAIFTLRGGNGGRPSHGGSLGGVGAQLRATLTVVPGQRFDVWVGGQGQSGRYGGFNGGGIGGNIDNYITAGRGGGASDVRPEGGGLEARLLVAAGGGGGGARSSAYPGVPSHGGAAGADGMAGESVPQATGGGAGLTAGPGGDAGTGVLPGVPGRPGAVGSGGDGGGGEGGMGGGGGGGWTGGGGGGSGGVVGLGDYGGGGGGAGGQSHAAAAASEVTLGLATQSGDGEVVVTFEDRSAGAPVVVSPPTLSGVVQVGSTLTCDPGRWSGAARLQTAWLRDGTPIAGATGAQLRLTAADAARAIACRITGTAGDRSTVAETDAVEVPPVTPIVNTVLPSVTGASVVGGTTTCDPGRWTAQPALTYRWLRDGVELRGATAQTREAAKADAGRTVQCAVTATVGAERVTALSPAVGGPARLTVLASTALVSRGGSVTVPVSCVGATACAIPQVVLRSSGRVIARAGARTVRPGASARIPLTIDRAARRRLARRGSSIPARVVATPRGGYGGNAAVRLVALRGVAG